MEKEENYCHYSDLPSPMAYVDCTDYDGMGNRGRFPKRSEHKRNMKRLIVSLLLWWSYRKKRERPSIWKLGK